MTTANFISAYPTLATMVEKNNYGHTLRALAFTDRIIAGDRNNYGKIIREQPTDNRLSLESFVRLNDFYYLFKVCPEMLKVLETYLVLDGYSKTPAGKDQLFYLPKDENKQNEGISNLLALARHGRLPEISRLSFDQYEMLVDVIGYRAYLERILEDAHARPWSFPENAQRTLLAASISLFATKDAREAHGSCPSLTESAASEIITLIINRYNPIMASQIYAMGKTAD